MDNDNKNNDADFFRAYLEYTGEGEVPPIFNRWCISSGIGAMMGRRVWLQHGRKKIYPNMYCMLLGVPGTRKSTAIRTVKEILEETGFSQFAPEKTTKEKFLMDLAGLIEDGGKENKNDFLSTPFDLGDDREMFIAADEFGDFFGADLMGFVSLLGVLWDWQKSKYESRVKNGISVSISNPTINILGGNTPTTFASTFPPDVIGQGFFSRLVPIYSDPTGLKVTFPPEPNPEHTAFIIHYLGEIKAKCAGQITKTQEAHDLIDKIYMTWKPLEDVRFLHYANRRLDHLLKLIIIHTVTRLSTCIEVQDVTYANTVLHHAEHFMPKAFGALGQARNSLLNYKVLQVIESALKPLTLIDIWEIVQADAVSMEDLGEILRSLAYANKIQNVEGKIVIKKKILEEQFNDCVDYRFLTNEERSYV